MRPLLLRALPALAGLLLAAAAPSSAQPSPTLDERLIRLEEGQRALAQRLDDTNRRLDDLRADVNRRFDDVNARFDDVNGRFDDLRVDMNTRFQELRADVNRQFDDLRLWLMWVLGALVAFVAALAGQGVLIWRRLTRLETTVSDRLQVTGRDQLIVQLRQEMAALAQRLDRLETGRP